MTAFFPFFPSSLGAPQFQPTFDGSLYLCTVTWNLFGQRYFVNCFDSNNALVFTLPLVESPAAKPIAAMSWSAASLRATITTVDPHGLKLGSVVKLTIYGSMPTGYNGSFDCRITSPNTFYYVLNIDPGQLVTLGTYSYLVSLTAGYFQSTMVYRNGQFEVNP